MTQWASKASEFGEITQNKCNYAVQSHIKVSYVGTNRKPVCDFLLVITSDISYRLECYHRLLFKSCLVRLSVCLYVNQDSIDHNRYTYRLVIMHAHILMNSDHKPKTWPTQWLSGLNHC